MYKNINIILILGIGLLWACTKDSGNDSSPAGGEGPGTGGSMARFTISNDHLFLINEKELKIFNIADEANPSEIGKIEVDFGIETVFSLNGKLFIGANNGVFIYDISWTLQIQSVSYKRHYEKMHISNPL